MKVKVPVLIVRGGIYGAALDSVNEQLSGEKGDQIYLVLDTFGGNPSVGYRIIRLLQAKYKKISAMVPKQAYSTGTLMALGCDEILMHKSACLGPLDTQIPHPTDGSMISSLEIRDTMNTVAGFVQTYSETFADSLQNNGNPLGKKDAWDLAMKTATEMIKPIVEKIDPIQLQSSSRSSRIGQKYAESLLASRMMQGNPKLARLVSQYLANNYDYHAYAIVLEEASGLLALNASDISGCSDWKDVEQLYNVSPEDTVSFNQIYRTETSPSEQNNTQTKTPKQNKIKNEKGGGNESE